MQKYEKCLHGHGRADNQSGKEPSIYASVYICMCVYIHYVYTHIYIYMYPVALSAISATVPTAFFVIRCESLKEKEPKQSSKTSETP